MYCPQELSNRCLFCSFTLCPRMSAIQHMVPSVWRCQGRRFVHAYGIVVVPQVEPRRDQQAVALADNVCAQMILAVIYDIPRRWGWASAPRADCLSRVSNERRGQDSKERREKRLSFIRSAEPSVFCERPEENLERLGNLAGAPAHYT